MGRIRSKTKNPTKNDPYRCTKLPVPVPVVHKNVGALDITVEEVTLVAIRQALWVKRTDDYGQCFGSGFRGLLYPDSEYGSGSRGLKKI